MFDATNGVNTHKGLLFSIGLICGAAGYQRTHQSGKSLSKILSQMCSGLVSREMGRGIIGEDSYGKLLYQSHRITGARGEAQAGFPSIFRAARRLEELLDTAARGLSGDLGLSALQVLLENMADFEDTNLAGRGGLEMLEYVKLQASRYLASGGVFEDEHLAGLRRMDEDLTRRHLSPGGSADTLAGALFIRDLEALNL